MGNIIETENLTKQYGTSTVVDNINIHVPKGKIYGFLTTIYHFQKEDLK